MAKGTEKLRAIYERMVGSGVIREVPLKVKREVRERFIDFYSRFDRRLRRINRENVCVTYTSEGRLYVRCVYYGVAYGQVYDN